ncbi:MAG: hypothetical protein AAFN74_06305, partial [Myxococcota bacterium]
IGLALDVGYSCLERSLSRADAMRIWRTLDALGLPLTHDALFADSARTQISSQVLDGLEEFRQHLGGQLTIMLLDGIGQGIETHEMDVDLVSNAARLVNAFVQGQSAPKAGISIQQVAL